MRTTPFHPRTSALNRSFLWKEWSGYAAVRTYDSHSEREYFALRHTAGLMDATPLYKYEVTGKDAGKLMSRVWTRDMGALAVGQVSYSAMADPHGQCLDDGTVARLAETHFRMTSSERWGYWLERYAVGLDVAIEDSTDRLACLALQGPHSRDILKGIVAWDMDVMRFFRIRKTTLAGIPVWVSRTGYTGDLGYEVWCANEHALAVWDAIIAAGQPYGLEPIGLDALDVVRQEAGFVLQGVDYISAKRCLIESRKSTPDEAGLAWTVDLDRDPFVGQDAIRAERKKGSEWAFVGLVLDWAALERLYEEYGLPPSLGPVASRAALPLFDSTGSKQIGQATSHTWSPLLKKALAIGQVYAPFGATGTEVQIEHTVDFHRRTLPAVVSERPFFDPERKKSTPKTPKGSKPEVA